MNKPGKAVRRCIFALTAMMAVLITGNIKTEAATNEKTVYQFLTYQMELTPAAACGVMSNIDSESGFRSDIYGMGGAYGLCQWTGVRRSRLQSWCAGNGCSASSVTGQLRFLQYELKTYFPGVDQYLKNLGNKDSDAYNAGFYWCYYFEIPANTYSTSLYRASRAQNTFWPEYGSSSLYVTAGVSGKGIKLSWNVDSKYGYQIKRAASSFGSYQTVGRISGGTKKSYTDSDVTIGKTYYYYMQPLDSKGNPMTRSNKTSCMAKASLQSSGCKITLSKVKYGYDGKEKKPKVTVKYASKKLAQGKDYTVAYSKNTNAGQAKVRITGSGQYAGSVTLYYTIQKAQQKITAPDINAALKAASVVVKAKNSGTGRLSYSVKNKKIAVISGGRLITKGVGMTEIVIRAASTTNYAPATRTIKLTVKPEKAVITGVSSKQRGTAVIKWKQLRQVAGYQLQYSTNSRMQGNVKTELILSGKTLYSSLKNLTGGKTWYFRIRGYRTINGKNLYGSWSITAKIKVKT
ncbi:MAG: phage tail tip lysozyme [Lachnospiraceae bacterium]|nr:phage tail tip lysozyme [Lachnospiraceae bacterium]